MRIIQITDLHIGRAEESTQGVDVRSNFLNILGEIKFSAADHVVITGDFCHRDGEADIYEWIKERMDKLDIPYDIISGNHDDSKIMAQVFDREQLLNDDEFYFAKKLGKWPCIFLDSSKAYHSEKQLKWLKRQLYQANEAVIIFMHHPPVKLGIAYMDKNHALKDMETIQQIFLAHAHNIQVYSGHYHVEKTVRFENISIQVTPSCYFQMDQTETNFKIDHYQIAMRVIDVRNKMIASTVRYFEGQKLKL